MRADDVVAAIAELLGEITVDDGALDRRGLRYVDADEERQLPDRHYRLLPALQASRRSVLGCARKRLERLLEVGYTDSPGVNARLDKDAERITQRLPLLFMHHEDIDRCDVTPTGVARGNQQVRSGFSVVVDYRSTADLELNVR